MKVEYKDLSSGLKLGLIGGWISLIRVVLILLSMIFIIIYYLIYI